MKNLDFVYLLDFYGGMLSERQRELMSLYYDDDLSLAEIADITGISRQGAHDFIKRGEAKLMDADKALGLVSRFEGIKDTVYEIENLIKDSDCKNKGDVLSLINKLKTQV
ncbi:MAG: hypothetical protein E7416_05550 [Ruminococcaceae bacterium]|nr:hypothetical protein [Oscillospiraceae bacterium]